MPCPSTLLPCGWQSQKAMNLITCKWNQNSLAAERPNRSWSSLASYPPRWGPQCKWLWQYCRIPPLTPQLSGSSGITRRAPGMGPLSDMMNEPAVHCKGPSHTMESWVTQPKTPKPGLSSPPEGFVLPLTLKPFSPPSKLSLHLQQFVMELCLWTLSFLTFPYSIVVLPGR